LKSGIGKRGKLMSTVLDRSLSHLEFVRMNEPLVLFELLVKHLHIDIITRLHTEELEIIDLTQQLNVLEVLAWVAS